jgi:uncharacterized membrane protein
MNVSRARDGFVAVAAIAGLYTSQHMYRKALRARRGELDEPSVVESKAGNLFFGQPNAILGLAYYTTLLAAIPLLSSREVRLARRVAAGLAASSSAYLGYSLLFVTKMPCVYCWTSHALNFAILAAVLSEA